MFRPFKTVGLVSIPTVIVIAFFGQINLIFLDFYLFYP